MEIAIRRLSIFTAVACVVFAAIGLIYRSTLFYTIPIAPGDPYGVGDVFEMLGLMIFLGLVALSLLLAVVLVVFPTIRDIPLASKVAIVSASSLGLWILLAPHMPRLL